MGTRQRGLERGHTVRQALRVRPQRILAGGAERELRTRLGRALLSARSQLRRRVRRRRRTRGIMARLQLCDRLCVLDLTCREALLQLRELLAHSEQLSGRRPGALACFTRLRA